jgi:hypothetical protein
MTSDRLQELASSSVTLSEILPQLRGAGMPKAVGPDPLVHADASDAVLDEFLSLAVREAAAAYATGAKPHYVFLGLAVSVPGCVIERGVGEEALEYCLAHESMSPTDLQAVFENMSGPRGSHESLCAAHRRISHVAIRAGHVGYYYQFLWRNIDELADECPDDLAEFMLDPRFPLSHLGLFCLFLAIEHSTNSEPYIQRWLDWIAEERFDSPTPDNATYTMYNLLRDHPDDARLRPVRVAAYNHLVHLVQSPEKLPQANLHQNAVWELSRDSDWQGKESDDFWRFVALVRPTGTQ